MRLFSEEAIRKFSMVDHGVIEAVTQYIMYGLPPGGFTTCLLVGDLEGAISRAHPSLKRWHDSTGLDEDNVIQNMFELCRLLPFICQGSHERVAAWVEMGGLQCAPKSVKALFKLSTPS